MGIETTNQSELDAVLEALALKGIDVEEALKALTHFRKVHEIFVNSRNAYNQAAQELALAMKTEPITKDQIAKYPNENMKVDVDFLKYYRLTNRSAGSEVDSLSELKIHGGDLPPEF